VQCAIGAICTWTREALSEDGERGSGSCLQENLRRAVQFLAVAPPTHLERGGLWAGAQFGRLCAASCVVWCGASRLVGGMSSGQMRSVTEPGIRISAARAACCVAEAMFTLLRKGDDVRCSGLCQW